MGVCGGVLEFVLFRDLEGVEDSWSHLVGSMSVFSHDGDRTRLEKSLQLNSLSVCVSVGSLWVTNFLILLQDNIRQLSRNCGPCAIEFAAAVNLNRHDTSTQTVMNVLTIFH